MTTIISGNLAADPEIRFTPSGVAAASFTIAVNERRKNAAGEWEDGPTSWVRCNAWRHIAEHICESLAKGDRVVAYGTFRQRDYQTAEGEKRTVWELTVTDIGPSLRYATTKIARAQREKIPDDDGDPPF